MSWTWRIENTDGTLADDTAPEFPTQADAESWLGEAWPDLLERGAGQVTLTEDGRDVYGPMGLDEG